MSKLRSSVGSTLLKLLWTGAWWWWMIIRPWWQSHRSDTWGLAWLSWSCYVESIMMGLGSSIIFLFVNFSCMQEVQDLSPRLFILLRRTPIPGILWNNAARMSADNGYYGDYYLLLRFICACGAWNNEMEDKGGTTQLQRTWTFIHHVKLLEKSWSHTHFRMNKGRNSYEVFFSSLKNLNSFGCRERRKQKEKRLSLEERTDFSCVVRWISKVSLQDNKSSMCIALWRSSFKLRLSVDIYLN